MFRNIENFQKAFNDDINFSGIFLKQYPTEEEWYKELQNKLSKFKRIEMLKESEIKQVKKDVIHPRDYSFIVNNFIMLYNRNETPKARLARQSSSEKNIINNRYVEYKVNFFVEFPNRKSYYGYEIQIHLLRDATQNKNFKFENSIINVELKGGVGLSDILYGVPEDKNEKNVKFYKDTNEYGEYLFTFKDNEIKQILKEKSGQVNEPIKGVIVGSGRNVIQNRPQRHQYKKQPEYVPKRTYTQPSAPKGKLRLGGQCLSINSFDKIVTRNCEDAKEFQYDNMKLKHQDKCLSYHADGNLELMSCDNLNRCKPNEDLNNCMNFKFVKYGGLEIDGNNSCLNPNKNTFIAEPCDTSANADLK